MYSIKLNDKAIRTVVLKKSSVEINGKNKLIILLIDVHDKV